MIEASLAIWAKDGSYPAGRDATERKAKDLMGCDCSPTKFAFAELRLRDRIALLDSLLRQLTADQVRVAVNDLESLGLVVEARLIGLTRSDELVRYLSSSAVKQLGQLVSDALVARLPRS